MNNAAATASIYWHDFETWGAVPQVDRPVQFAGVRTDLDLNIIGRPLTIYAQPTPDFLPHPDAVMITGITPQLALNQGMRETEFAAKIHAEFSQAQTTIVGYNNLNFDDEVTRFLFYRNFIDPYAHTWQQQNARWDLIDLMRACYALRPEGIEWPTHPDGRVSMKLEDLTRANGIDHGQAHDAMADVYATIAMAKRIKQAQPKLYDYSFKIRRKKEVLACFDLVNFTSVLHVSGFYGAERSYTTLLMPLAYHPYNNNAIICWDLNYAPEALADMTSEQIRERLYTPRAELAEAGLSPVGLTTIQVNKCPFVATPKVLDQDRAAAIGLSFTQCEQHRQALLSQVELRDRLVRVFDALPEYGDAPADPDLQLYSGPFFSDQDKTNMNMIRATAPEQLAAQTFNFDDGRLPEMLFRYRARNFPATLSQSELMRWQAFCRERLTSPPAKALSVTEFIDRLEALAEKHQQNPNKMALLKDLYRYAESL